MHAWYNAGVESVESRLALAERIRRIAVRLIPRSARVGLRSILAIAVLAIALLPMGGGRNPLAAAERDKQSLDGLELAQAEADKAAVDSSDNGREPRGVLSGRILDDLGQPVTDAELRLEANVTAYADTDDEGYYHFDTVKQPGEYRLEIKSDRCIGFTDFYKKPQVNLSPAALAGQQHLVRNFTLPRGAAIKLQVLDTDGRPIDDARVYSRLLTDETYRVDGEDQTDKTGWVTLGGLRPSSDKRIVGVTSDDHAFGKLLLVVNQPGELTHQMRLADGVEVTGKAICSDGKPAAGWRINALPTWWRFGRHPRGAEVQKDGSFVLKHVGLDRYQVSVSIPTGEGSSTSLTLEKDEPLPTADRTLALKIDRPSPGAEVAIEGQIEYSGKELEKGFNIWCYGTRGPFTSFNSYVMPGQTDFRIDHVLPGEYRVEFESSEFEKVVLPRVTAPAKDLKVKIDVRGLLRMTGAVVHADGGEVVPDFRVMVKKLRGLGQPDYLQQPNWHEFQTQDGRFSIDLVGPGVYTAVVEAKGLGAVQTEQLTYDGKSNPVLQIELGGKRNTLEGTVVNTSGRPVDGALIVPLEGPVARRAVTPVRASEAGAVQSERGQFAVVLLTPTQETLRVWHPDYAPQVVGLDADTKSGAKPLKIVLTEGTTLRGNVYGSRGEPQANVTLHMKDRRAGGYGVDESESRLASIVTDASGFYEVKRLPAVRLEVERAESWNTQGVTEQAILLDDGGRQTLDFGGPTRLTGRLVVNGTPLAGTRIHLYSGTSRIRGQFRASGETDADGVFALFGVPPGEKTLLFQFEGDVAQSVPAKTFRATRTPTALGTIECLTGTVTVKPVGDAVPADENVLYSLMQYNDVWTEGQHVGRQRRRKMPDDPVVYEGVPLGKYLVMAYRQYHLQAMTTVEVTVNALRPTATVDDPHGTASLSGKLAESLSEGHRGRNLKLWSADQHLRGDIRPGDDGTYRLENLPAGQYLVKEHDTRDAAALTSITLADGEAKTLDITPELLVNSYPQAYGVVNTYTAGGVPLAGCEVQLASGDDIALRASQDGRMTFMGKAGTHPIVLSYPGFQSVKGTVELKLPLPDGNWRSDLEVSYKLPEAD